MARKKKLNKNVVILLAAIGLILVLLVVSYKIYTQPRDPKAAEAAANEALAKEPKDYATAVKEYEAAVAGTKDLTERSRLRVELGKARLEWIRKDPSLGESKRDQEVGLAYEAFRKATLDDPRSIEAQRQQTQFDYEVASHPRNPTPSESWLTYIKSASRLLELVPDDNETLSRRAQAKVFVAEALPAYVTPATEDLAELVRRDPKQEDYWLAMAEFQHRNQVLGRADKGTVEPIYRNALKANPESVKLRVALADFLRGQGEDRRPESMALLQEAVKLGPKQPDGHLALAESYQRDRDLAKAEEALNQAIASAPQDYRAYVMLARIYAGQKAPDKAEAVLMKGLEAVEKAAGGDPSLSDQEKQRELFKYRNSLAALTFQLCDALLDRMGEEGKKEELLPRVHSALEKLRGAAPESPAVAKIEGRLALLDGDVVKAEKLLRDAYDRFRFEAGTAQLLINIYRALGQPGEAQQIIQRYLLLVPDNPQALMSLARMNMDYRLFDQAAQNVAAALKVEPENKEALELKGIVEVLSGTAEKLPDTVTGLDTKESQLLLGRARQLWSEGKPLPAMVLANEVLRVQPNSLEAIVQLIQWYQSRNETDFARRVLDHGLKVYKDNADVRDRLILLAETDPTKQKAVRLSIAAQDPDPVGRLMKTASVYASYGETDEQLKCMKEAEKLRPNEPNVIESLFQHYFLQRDWDTARVYAQKAAEADIDHVGGRYFQARLAFGQGKWDEAIALISEVIQQRSRFSQAYSFLGDCYLAKQDFDHAREAYDTAYQQNPGNVGALLGLVSVSEAAGRTGEYTHYLELAYKFSPENPLVRERYLRLLESRVKPEEVIGPREQLRRQHPENLANLLQLGELYERVGRIAAAEDIYGEILRRAPGNPQTLRLLAELYRKTDRAEKAFSMLAGFAESAKDKVGACLLLADYLEDGQDTTRAANAVGAAIKADAKDARGYAAAARFAARRQEWSQAVANQRKYMEVSGSNAVPFANETLIGYMIEDGQFQTVDAMLDKALAANPSNASRFLSLKGLSLFRQKQYDQALAAFDRAMVADPNFSQGLLWRAEVYRAKGDTARCIADLEAARQRNPSPQAIFPLVRLYESIGDFANARAVLQSFLVDHPGHEAALRELVGLCQRHGKLDLLQNALTDALKLYPQSIFFISQQIELWLERGYAEQAIPVLQNARKVLPQSTEISTLLARAMVMTGQFDQVIETTKPYLGHPDVGPIMTAVTALACAKKGDLPRADQLFQDSLAKAVSDQQLAQVVGYVSAAYGPKAGAAKLLAWVLTRPKDCNYRYLLGQTLMTAGDFKAAKEQLLKGLELADKPEQRFRLVRQLALAHYQAGEMEDSRKRYIEAAELDPSDGITLNNLAWLLVNDLKRGDEALPFAEKAVKIQPNNPEAIDTLGLVLTATGKYRQAEEVLLRSISLEAMPANLLHLTQLYEKTDRKNDAIRYCRQGWDMVKGKPGDSDHKALREAMQRLGELPADK